MKKAPYRAKRLAVVGLVNLQGIGRLGYVDNSRDKGAAYSGICCQNDLSNRNTGYAFGLLNFGVMVAANS